MKNILLAFMYIITATCLCAQSAQYDIYVGKRHTGTLEVTIHTDGGGDSKIQLTAHSAVLLMNIYTFTSAEYRNGQLRSSISEQKLNGKLRERMRIHLQEGHYHMQAGQEMRSHQGAITWSVAMLYQREPKGIKQVFSERFGVYCNLKEVAPHHYELLMPDGKTTHYSYRNGVCAEVQSAHTMGSIRMVRIDTPAMARK
ncbi:MAG TPA: hypothetical protein PKC76_13470 [Saprospiraceae bacterium]|nr:hypothetical protein [Saprospiraceae bacterium]HMP25143.1 hypothetical protein [Saprospiraceae bacterium]